MISRRNRLVWRILGIVAVLALALGSAPAAIGQQGGPIITTPTPPPTPTPPVLTARQLLALTPEAQRHGSVVYLPLGAQNSGGRSLDVDAAGFSYEVQPGDSLWSLALDFGRDLDTMACATTPLGADVEALKPGDVLTVPALTDVCYTVTPFDTLAAIAASYGLTVADIAAVPWNGFGGPPYTVTARQRVLLPGVRTEAKPRAERSRVSYMSDTWARSPYSDWPFGDGSFIWPVTGPISQYAHDGHWALDIAVPVGSSVQAADRGTVVLAGWSPVGYGFRVVIDHGNDYITLYAHLSDIYAETGQVVGKGQVIGVSGANGNITGPHLHFELRDFGRLVDPLSLLP